MVFKIKIKSVIKSKDFVPKLILDNVEFTDTIYDSAYAYHPIWFEGGKKIKCFRAYFYTDSGYWKYIKTMDAEEFKLTIKPILKNVKIKGL
jgi:hypothetical protein